MQKADDLEIESGSEKPKFENSQSKTDMSNMIE